MRARWITGLALLGWLLSAGFAGAFAADEPVALKAGASSDTTAAYCSACHTTDYIIMNSPFLTPQAWKAEVAKMRSLFGAPIDEQTAASITDYLVANYAVAPKP